MPRLSCWIFAVSLLLVSNGAGAEMAFMPTAGPTAQPVGHYDLCRSDPAECAERDARPGRVVLSAAKWDELLAVNTSVNAAIIPRSDIDLFGLPEVWAYADGFGDCEDYVLVKRRELAARGWPLSALLVTVVRQEGGEGHAVLTVLTDRGDLILDNLDGRVRVWNETPYHFVKRQSERDSGAWLAVGDDRPLMVGAVR